MKKIAKTVAMAMAAGTVFANIAFAAVTMEQAKQIAFKKAGVSAAATVYEQKTDHSKHFGSCFEFEFAEGSYKYEAKITASTGEIVKFEMEKIK